MSFFRRRRPVPPEGNAEEVPSPGAILNPDAPSVKIHDTFRDGKPEPQTAVPDVPRRKPSLDLPKLFFSNGIFRRTAAEDGYPGSRREAEKGTHAMDDRSPSEEGRGSTGRDKAEEKATPTHLESAEGAAMSREGRLQAELEHLIRRAIDQRMAEEEKGVDLDAEDALSGLDLDEQSFYREFVGKSNDAMYVVDLFGSFKFVNQTAARLMGYRQEELLGKNIARFLYPEGLKKAASIMASLIRGRKIPPYEMVVKAADGDRVGEINATLIKRGGFPVGILGVARDVTEHKKADKSLESSLARFEAVFNSIADAAVFADTERRIVAVNPAFVKLWGHRAEEVRGRTTEFLYADRESYEEQGKVRYAADADSPPGSFETRYRRRDGTIFQAESTSTKVLDAQGAVLGYVAIHRDVTKRRKAEDVLRESEGRYRKLVELSPDAVAIIQDDRFVYANPAFTGLFGYSPEDISRGLNYLSLTRKQDRDTIRSRYENRLAGKEVPATYRVDLLDKEGKVVKCETSASRIEHKGRPGNLVIFRDITERVETSQLLEAQHELALGLASTSTLKEGLELCMRAALKASGMDSGGVYLLDEGEERLKLVHSRNLSRAFIDKVKSFPLDSHQGRLAMEGKPLFSRVEGREKAIRDDLEIDELRALAILPIVYDRKVIGCMNVSSKKVVEIHPSRQRALESISTQIGSALARLKTESALRESEERYRQLVANIPVVAWKSDSDGRMSFISPNVERLCGYTSEEILKSGGALCIGRIHEDDIDRVKRSYQAIFTEKKDFDVEYRFRRKDGEWIWIRDRAFSRQEEGGKHYAFGVFSEITERKEAEEALRRSEDEHRALVATLAQGIQEIDTGGTILFANRAHHRMYGYDDGELIGMSALDLSPDEKTRRELAQYLKYLLAEQPEPTPWTGEDITKDGKRILVQVDWNYKRDDAGRIVGFTSVISDITERQRAEEALRESEERYRSLVEKSEEIIFSITTEGRFNFLNPAFSHVTGWKTDEWVGRSFEDLVHPDEQPSVQARFARVMKGETLPQNEVRIRTSRGDMLTVEYTTVPIRQKGRIVEIWGIARDATSRLRAEEDHRRLVALKEREGISRWLHDHLGADLYNIILLVDSLQKQDPDVTVAAQQLDWISETSRKALASIRNYLDFSSQMGASFGSLVGHMEKYGRSLLTPLGVGFDITRSGSMETCALSGLQSFSIYLIFKESLTNIVKHARADHVDVTIAVGKESLEIVVADDGEGFTSDAIISGQYGTANIRARAEEMGADLYITTEPRQGTKVKFILPLT